ncbi:phospholipase D-like domain-containing protein [Polaromonas aquatica]|uniref:phospholipase D-like domain-containing protein n=1 Tax=Polaromonas aquatica TaxID=332657 RepID=UPI003D659852
MRNKTTTPKLTVNAIAGTNVVFLGFDMPQASSGDLMGFSIKRTDGASGESKWLRGLKSFASQYKDQGDNTDYSSYKHPFQSFQWADYTAEPDTSYDYEVHARGGTASALTTAAKCIVTVKTETADGNPHSVYFNRGAIASQAYARRFNNEDPDKVGAAAVNWLTRDLLPGILSFIARAESAEYELHCAIFETKYEPVLQALIDASIRGVKVQLVYSAKPGKDTTVGNEEMIGALNMNNICIKRTVVELMHNKFMVLSRKGKPQAVLTGSANLSRNAMIGQLNVAHVIEGAAMAKDFLEYWQYLADDKPLADVEEWNMTRPLPPANNLPAAFAMFLPYANAEAIGWMCEVANQAEKGLFMNFPFGIGDEFRDVYRQDGDVLRFALLDKVVNGGNAAYRERVEADTLEIRKRANVVLAVGSRVFTKKVDGWLLEAKGLGVNVNWVHTKFMLCDPLGANPIVITGSANFSNNSVKNNDENMIVIKGDQRVADIYFTEYMRLFAHHAFRESLARYVTNGDDAARWEPKNLFETAAEWVPPYYSRGSIKAMRRKYFAG